MGEVLLKSLAWTDYRLTVLFALIIPLALSIWAVVQKNALHSTFAGYLLASS